MYGKIYLQDNIQEFIRDFKELPTSDKYLNLIKITSSFYDLEVNGIHIENLQTTEDQLLITTWNNRMLKLKIVDDLEIRILSEKIIQGG